MDTETSRTRRHWVTLSALPITLLCLCAPLTAENAIAFVSEAQGESIITRVDDTALRAVVGSQLFLGDKLKVARGQTVLVYLSGRSVKIGPGPVHVMSAEATAASPLIARLSTALEEIAATTDDKEAPTVHGMARDIGIAGAVPADTKLLSGDFTFTWEALEGVEEYIVALSPAGSESVTQSESVHGTTLEANRLSLMAGVRYTWTVKGKDSVMGGSSRAMWFEIALPGDIEKVKKSVRYIESRYENPTSALLKATLYYDNGFYGAAERTLQTFAQAPGMKAIARRLLQSLGARVQPQPPTPQKND